MQDNNKSNPEEIDNDEREDTRLYTLSSDIEEDDLHNLQAVLLQCQVC